MEDTRFYVRKLSAEDIDFFIQERGIAADNILFAIEGADGVEFSENITLTFKVDSLDHSIIPVIHTLDMTAKTFSQREAIVTLDPSTKTVTLEVSHFCALAAEIQDYYRQKGEAYCSDPETSCRCGRIKVEQGDSDFSCSDKTSGCQVVSSESTVTYLDCDPVLESVAKSEEVCEDCVPVMDFTADRVFVNPGGSVLLSSLIRIGCAPFDNQLVSFAIESGAGTLSLLGGNTGASGSSGVMKTTLTAGGSEGKVTVSASSDIKYYYSQTFFSLTGEDDEEIKDPEEGVTHFLNKTIDIYVTELPELELVPDSTKIEPGGTISINAWLTKGGGGSSLSGQTVAFTVSGPGTLGSATGTTDPAITTLTAGGSEGKVTVSASSDIKYYYSQTFFSLTGEDDEEIKDPEEGVTHFLNKTIDIYVTELPELELVPDSTKIEPGGTISVNAWLTKGGSPLSGQTVAFTVSGPGTLGSATGTTDPAITTLTSGGEGTITVTAKCSVNLTVAGESVVIPVEKSVQILSDELIRSFHITVNVGPMALSGSVGSFYSMSVDSYSMNYEFDLNVPGSIKGKSGAFGFSEISYSNLPNLVRLPDVVVTANQTYSNFQFSSDYVGDFGEVYDARNLNTPSSFSAKPEGRITWSGTDPALDLSIGLSEDDGEYSPFTYDVYCTSFFGESLVSRISLYQVYFYPAYEVSLFDGNVVNSVCRIDVGAMRSYVMPITITVEETEKK